MQTWNYQKASQDPSKYSTMQGLQYGAIERAATAAAAAEVQRLSKQQSSGSSSQTAGVYRVELTSNGRTNSL